jgi:hypothetical protein
LSSAQFSLSSLSPAQRFVVIVVISAIFAVIAVTGAIVAVTAVTGAIIAVIAVTGVCSRAAGDAARNNPIGRLGRTAKSAEAGCGSITGWLLCLQHGKQLFYKQEAICGMLPVTGSESV